MADRVEVLAAEAFPKARGSARGSVGRMVCAGLTSSSWGLVQGQPEGAVAGSVLARLAVRQGPA